MGIESVVICVDNSEWMRNGDFIPTRLQAQQDAVNVVARSKVRDNPETTVGLLTMADTSVRVPLTTDAAKLLKELQNLEPKGNIKFITGIRIAHLALKHRQNKNHKMRIVVFVASPIVEDSKEIERLAKRLKKEKVHIDVVSFGEENDNMDKLKSFIDILNGKDPKDKCHLVQATPGPLLSDVLIGSPILVGEDGAPIAVGHGGGFEFGMDPIGDDPELAMALRVSLEEQRQRQEEEAARVQQESLDQMQTDQDDTSGLAQATAAELPYNPAMSAGGPQNVSAMTEEEQLEFALRMSMAAIAEETPELSGKEGVEEMDTGGTAQKREEGEGGEDAQMQLDDDDMQELMGNREYLESVLSSLPGVNPEEALHNLEEMRQAAQQQGDTKQDDKNKKDDA